MNIVNSSPNVFKGKDGNRLLKWSGIEVLLFSFYNDRPEGPENLIDRSNRSGRVTVFVCRIRINREGEVNRRI